MNRALESLQQPDFYRWVFLVAAAYNIGLGVAFTFLYKPILDVLDLAEPYNASYITLAAVLIAVQGLAYLFVWRNLAGNIDLIRVGILYKAGYSAVAIYYLAIGDLLHWVFFLFAVIDIGFLLLFVGALRALGNGRPVSAAAA